MNIVEALSNGPRTSKEIQALTGMSQASVSRVARTESTIVRMPGPAPYRYAATKTAFDAGQAIPIATIDANGKTLPRAVLRPLMPKGYLIGLLAGSSHLLLGENEDGFFDGVPYFLEDARPQGFLGKMLARRLAEQSDDFTADPDKWTEEQFGRYLISNGDDLPGDYIFGAPMLNRVRNIPQVQNREHYAQIATNTMAGFVGGTSAGGEQPKFTAFISDTASHVIVKFSPAQDDLTAARWRDILVTEFHALNVLSEFGFTAAQTQLFDQQGRYFLESKRFDRIGTNGRSSMLSLRTIDAELTGVGGDWSEVAEALHKLKLVSFFDWKKISALEQFGGLINNTDMHLGNLSLSIDGDRFSLLPVYDMCSMGFSPKGTEVADLAFKALERILESQSFESNVLNAAIEFWQRVARDERTSAELRNYVVESRIGDRISQRLKN